MVIPDSINSNRFIKMKSIKLFYPVLILFIVGLNLNSCKNNTAGKTQTKEIPTGEISVNDFEQKLNVTTNAQIVDVRTPEEFDGGHLFNALNIDFNGADFEMKVQALDKTRPTFVYCLSGGRSHKAAELMTKSGFTEIYEMQGGMKAWNKAGKPVVTPEKTNEKKEVTMEDYTKEITSDKMVLVDFNAPWCGPCKIMAPMLEEIATEQKESLNLIKINSDDNKNLSTSLKVENLPTLILYKKGKEVWKHEGAIDKIGLMVAIESQKK